MINCVTECEKKESLAKIKNCKEKADQLVHQQKNKNKNLQQVIVSIFQKRKIILEEEIWKNCGLGVHGNEIKVEKFTSLKKDKTELSKNKLRK